MRVVSIGDLVLDFYYKDNKLLGACGGMTSHNIIANLSNNKIDTKVFGVCGNDSKGKLAIKSLSDLNVDTKDIIIKDNLKTRSFQVSFFKNKEFTSKKRCPKCNEKEWYEESQIDTTSVINNLLKDDILVFDNLNNKNQEIINKTKNKKLLDLGQYFELDNYKDKEIVNLLNNKFEIINLNERVSNYLIERFKLSNELELFNLIKPNLLIITKGTEGSTYIYNNKIYNFKLEEVIESVDPTGAGDTYFASIIKEYINNNLEFDEKLFSKWNETANKSAKKVLTKIGARSHIQKLYKIKEIKDKCICKDFEINERNKIKRCNININNLESRMLNVIKNDISKKLDKINFNEKENYIFVGTGGSFAGAKFASIIINELFGSNTYAMYPRDIIYRNNNNIDKVILFSYSGTTNDLLVGTKEFDNVKKYVITKGKIDKIIEKTNLERKNIISYRSSNNIGKEHGFLSFEGAVVPAIIFFDFYNKKQNLNINIEEFISKSFNHWKEYLNEQFKKEEIKNIFKKNNTINIFTGDNTYCAGYDTESKIIESGIVNCILQEKKNFSHGRFINYENLNNKNNIYFKSSETTAYESKLLEYIKEDNNLILESKYKGIMCELDLLIASQLIIYYVGKILDIDVSKPSYTENALKVYFYKGEL